LKKELFFVRLFTTVSLLPTLPIHNQHLNLHAHNEDFAVFKNRFWLQPGERISTWLLNSFGMTRKGSASCGSKDIY